MAALEAEHREQSERVRVLMEEWESLEQQLAELGEA